DRQGFLTRASRTSSIRTPSAVPSTVIPSAAASLLEARRTTEAVREADHSGPHAEVGAAGLNVGRVTRREFPVVEVERISKRQVQRDLVVHELLSQAEVHAHRGGIAPLGNLAFGAVEDHALQAQIVIKLRLQVRTRPPVEGRAGEIAVEVGCVPLL